MSLPFPDIDPVALAIGPLQIRWYALAYLGGFLLGWSHALRLVRLNGEGIRPDKNDIDDFIPWAIAGVILGGRIGYILFYQSAYYLENPFEIFKVWHGGMAFHGGIIGVVTVLILYARLKKIPLLRLSDITACAAPVGIFLGRCANFINGELYGRVTAVPWGVAFPGGGPLPRHPSQIYEALMEGALLFSVLLAAACVPAIRQRPGILSAMFLTGYGVLRGIGELFREPDEQIGFLFGAVSMGQVLSLPVVFLGFGVLFYALRCQKRNP